jgi:hypothetical protein
VCFLKNFALTTSDHIQDTAKAFVEKTMTFFGDSVPGGYEKRRTSRRDDRSSACIKGVASIEGIASIDERIEMVSSEGLAYHTELTLAAIVSTKVPPPAPMDFDNSAQSCDDETDMMIELLMEGTDLAPYGSEMSIRRHYP